MLSLALLLTASSLYAQIEVPQVQKSLYTPLEATWCGYCGKNGIPTTAAIYQEVKVKAIFMDLQPSSTSALYASKAKAISNQINPTGYPSVAINAKLKGVLHPGIKNQLVAEINANYSANSAEVNAGFQWYRTEDSLIVYTNTKYFQAQNGDFYTGVYLTQDSIWEYQANYDANIPNGNIYHNHILREVLSKSSFGIPSGTGAIASGTEHIQRHAIKWKSTWKEEHIHLNTVVWKKENNKYVFQNANNIGEKVKAPELSVESNDGVFLEIYPNPVNSTLFFPKDQENTRLTILQSDGKLVKQFEIGNQNGFQIDVSELAQGLYFIQGTDENGRKIQARFVKE